MDDFYEKDGLFRKMAICSKIVDNREIQVISVSAATSAIINWYLVDSGKLFKCGCYICNGNYKIQQLSYGWFY